MRRTGYGEVIAARIALALLLVLVLAVLYDLKTFRLQAELFAWLDRRLTYEVRPGENAALRLPAGGPYDERLGYSRLPELQRRLLAAGFAVESQAVHSSALAGLVELGGIPPYRLKTRAGLTVLDRGGRPLHEARFPERGYARFAEVPPILVESLLHIENRELLDPTAPARNPALEWDRLARVTAGHIAGLFGREGAVGGASTLATQIEKFRHSPGGRTEGAGEKLRQMLAASLRAYLDGPDTTEARQRIVVDYLNATPLGGRAGIGEMNGLAAGLAGWYGADFDAVNRLLADPAAEPAARALAYRQALSLLLAQRRPQAYLVQDREALRRLTDLSLERLAAAGVIPAGLRDAARAAPLRFAEAGAPAAGAGSFVERKAGNAIRAELLALLGEDSAYRLDRLDLSAETSLDAEAQAAVTEQLRALADPAQVRALGLAGPRLLGRGDPAEVVYSVTLFERLGETNVVRIQADTLERPFDLNRGAKLDLGSTAKLRTLVSYLQIVQGLHRRYAEKERYQLDAIARDAADPLTDWAVRTLAAAEQRDLPSLLAAALERPYPADPAETFFTGGGLHRFENFDSRHDDEVVTLAEAFRHSINLPFVRLMRDMIDHLIAEGEGRGLALLADLDHPARKDYLARYADQDGGAFLDRFLATYRRLPPEKALESLLAKVRRASRPLAAVFRSVRPEGDPAALGGFLRERLGAAPGDEALGRLHDSLDPRRLSLIDRAYLAGLHPLELWLVGYLQGHPEPSRAEVLAASGAERQAVMAWLIESERHGDQNTRIWTMLEQEAFERLHRGWKTLGYPFGALVPSYATSIGSSADRPDALAELVGIVVNEGYRRPTQRVGRLRFAEGTPYETNFVPVPPKAERVLAPEIAATLREALIDVVEQGTARRARGALAAGDGSPLPIGGKTGTGDNRFKTFDSAGTVIDERVVNRTATFAFLLGERFFGTITAYVDGPEAEGYGFTSSLPAALLKLLSPAFQSLIGAPLARGEQASG